MRWVSCLFVAVFAVTAVRSAEPSPLAGKRPNIIIIMPDDQGYGDLACHGNPIIRTPNLDRLFRESTRLKDFHVSPTCAPTRSALMTGRHEFRNGVTHTIMERERLTLKATTLPQVLKSASYTSGIFGKWHLGDEDAYQPGKRGFDEVFIHGCGGIGQTYPGSCGDAPGNKYDNPVIRHNGNFVATKGYCTDVFFNQAIQWIDSVRGKQPFFCYITPNAPHAPLDCPAGSDKEYEGKVPPTVAKFYGMITNVDANVGKLLDRLKEWKIEEQTLVIFMTDNGTATGSNVHNAGMRGQKGTPYTGGTRVPGFWRWPGMLKAGVDVEPLTCHWDILPTLIELTGAKASDEVKKQIEGRSLTPLLVNPSTAWADRYFVTHVGRWPTDKAADGKYANASIRDARWQLVFAAGKKDRKRELFDLRNDPGEKTDVSAAHPEVVNRLTAEFDKWWDQVVPMMVNEGVKGPDVNPYRTAYWAQYGGPGPNKVPPPKKK